VRFVVIIIEPFSFRVESNFSAMLALKFVENDGLIFLRFLSKTTDLKIKFLIFCHFQ
jgi:hypothetical protein